MTYTIYADQLPEVEKKLSRIAKKAQTYGCEFSWTVSAPHAQYVAVMAEDIVNHVVYDTHKGYNVEAVDIEVSGDEMIRANGWTVIAKLEHGDQGNIVHLFGDASADEMADWRQRAGHCDHCHSHRQRKATFIVRHESGETRQVGTSCLHDYTGISERTALAWAEVQDILEQDFSCMDDERGSCGTPVYPVLEALTGAIQSINEKGYVKSSEPHSTKESTYEYLLSNVREESSEALAEAQRVFDWLTKEEHSADSIEANAAVLAQSGWCKASHLGYIAYAPVEYRRQMERKAQEAARASERAEQAQTSEYIGEIGKRLTVALRACKLVTSWETAYGFTFLYKMEDTEGNVLVWFASSPAFDDGSKVKEIKATVKAHSERDGVRQTVVTRCKAI